MRKGTVVWVEGHTKDLWIEGFNCQVATQGILLEDIQKDAKKVKVCLNTLAGQSNIICDVRLSKLKGYNQEVLTEVYVYGSHLIGGRAKNNILNDFIYKKDIDIKFQVYNGNYDLTKAKQYNVEDILPRLIKKLKQDKVKLSIKKIGFTYVVTYTPINENISAILRMILTYMEKKFGIMLAYSDCSVFHVEYNGDFVGLLKHYNLI